MPPFCSEGDPGKGVSCALLPCRVRGPGWGAALQPCPPLPLRPPPPAESADSSVPSPASGTPSSPAGSEAVAGAARPGSRSQGQTGTEALRLPGLAGGVQQARGTSSLGRRGLRGPQRRHPCRRAGLGSLCPRCQGSLREERCSASPKGGRRCLGTGLGNPSHLLSE